MTTKKTLNRTVGLLMHAMRAIEPDSTQRDVLESSLVRATNSGRLFSVPRTALRSIDKALVHLKPAIDSYPLESFRTKLTATVVDVRDRELLPAEAFQVLATAVGDLIAPFRAPGEWEIAVAVRNVNGRDLPVAVGCVQLLLMDDATFYLWASRYTTGHYSPPRTANVSKHFIDTENEMRGQIVALAKVHAIDQEHARAKAQSRIEETLDLLRYAGLFFDPETANPPILGLQLRQSQQEHYFIVRIDKPGAGTGKTIGANGGLPISLYRQVPAWDELQRLISGDSSTRTDMQSRIIRALQWVGLAALTPTLAMRLVSTITALEALLIGPHESLGKKKKLGHRVSSMIPTSPDEAATVRVDVERLYRLRSEAVHGARTAVSGKEIFKSVEIVGRVIKILSNEPFVGCASLDAVIGKLPAEDDDLHTGANEWIAVNAYLRWEAEGRPQNRELQHWSDAEREFTCARRRRN